MTDAEIIQKNLCAANDDRRRADAIEAGQIAEFVQRLRMKASADISPEEAFARYNEVFSDRPLLSQFYAQFILQLQISGMLDIRLFGSDVFPVSERRIYYSKSPYTDAALVKFSSLLSAPVLCAETDLQAICEAVSSEEHSYGVLPISDSVDGELPAFVRMIHAYQLKICAVCDIPTSDGEKELRLALLSDRLHCAPGSTFLDVSFTPESDRALVDALASLAYLDAEICRINARPLEYNRNRFLYNITVSAAPNAFAGLAAFTRTAMNASLDGVYPLL